jgi:hypothetical protein
MAEVKIKKSAPTRETEVESVTVKPSENGGFVVTCQKRPKPSKKAGAASYPSPWVEPDTYTYESLEGVEGFLRETFPK